MRAGLCAYWRIFLVLEIHMLVNAFAYVYNAFVAQVLHTLSIFGRGTPPYGKVRRAEAPPCG